MLLFGHLFNIFADFIYAGVVVLNIGPRFVFFTYRKRHRNENSPSPRPSPKRRREHSPDSDAYNSGDEKSKN